MSQINFSRSYETMFPSRGDHWSSALRYTYYMITRQFNATHLFIMTGLQSHFIVNDFKIGCICSTNFAPFPHQLSKILCTLFSSTKLSVLRTIEKHCMGTIWLLGAKLWTDFQTITSRNDFLDRWYHWTTLSVQKIIVNHGSRLRIPRGRTSPMLKEQAEVIQCAVHKKEASKFCAWQNGEVSLP